MSLAYQLTSVSPGKQLEMQILRASPRHIESETLEWGSAVCVLTPSR